MISISRLYCAEAEPGDKVRYRMATHPDPAPRPVVVWNTTKRCNLDCVHCYSHSTDHAGEDELSLREGKALLDDMAAFGSPVILFSGGEPLMRPDILELIHHAAGLGLRTVLSTNGTLLTPEIIRELLSAGLIYAGISLDGLESIHNRFRRKPDAFARAMAGVEACQQEGLKVGLRFTLTRQNRDDLPGIFDLLAERKIPRLCVYHLVYTGRGDHLSGEDLSHSEMRVAMDLMIDRTRALHEAGHKAEVLTVDNYTDGPYMLMRMVRENHPHWRGALKLMRSTGGDGSGARVGCVSWDGTVHPDQFWRTQVLGSIRERPFSEIWRNTEGGALLKQLRSRSGLLKGRCSKCVFQSICNGSSRARGWSLDGDPWAADPACYLTGGECCGDAVPDALKAALAAKSEAE